MIRDGSSPAHSSQINQYAFIIRIHLISPQLTESPCPSLLLCSRSSVKTLVSYKQEDAFPPRIQEMNMFLKPSEHTGWRLVPLLVKCSVYVYILIY